MLQKMPVALHIKQETSAFQDALPFLVDITIYSEEK